MKTLSTAAVLLGVAAFGSALGVAYVEHLNRELHYALHELALQRNSLDTEWGQLLLQQSTLADPRRVEAIATGKLAMVIPGQRDIVVIWP